MTPRKRKPKPKREPVESIVRPSTPPPDFKPTTMNIHDDGPGGNPDPWASVEEAQDFYDAFLYDMGDR